jgi:glycosyltransferase involved in cell wall biosynthesis
MPTLSCIVPVYNSEAYLGQALDSILAQTLLPAEIIIIDDGSTDATPMIAAKYARHVSYIRQENQGPAGARNAGLRVAGGEFLAFLDADDTWHPEKLERQMNARAEFLDRSPGSRAGAPRGSPVYAAGARLRVSGAPRAPPSV